jgi:4-hydroxybenzoate polyprenyltransferase
MTRAYVDLARPFTLVAPALGFMSGALTAVGAAPREAWTPTLLMAPFIGSMMAALLNAGNNALNQIYDLDIDRVNKPKRPLPSGRLAIGDAWRFAVIAYTLSLVLAWLVAPGGRHECFWLVLVAVVCTFIYSMPPLRTKRLGIWANVTIAIPRGTLLKVAGWSSVKTIAGIEPW